MNASNRASLWVMLLILVVGSFFSAVIPPFQSPDEADHIKRAYLLSKGTIILDAPEGMSSGGDIDSGLAAYIDAYAVLFHNFHPDRKLSSNAIESAKSIEWTGIREFSSAPGTGYYFPIIYLPQTIGLALGERLALSVDASYQLARLMALAVIAMTLSAAFKIYPVSPLAIALLIIPMSVFQFSSASLDGVSTALAVFSLAAFLRLADEKADASPWLFYALTLSVVLLATCRAYLLPLLALVLMACFYSRDKKYFYVFAFALFFVLAWLVIAMKTTVYPRIAVGTSTGSVAFFYLKNPSVFFDVLMTTLSKSDVVNFYLDSFFGILGWLDTRFSEKTYDYLTKCTFLIALLSVSIKTLYTEWMPRLVLLLCAIFSIFLIFFALLISYNPHPATQIEGVQGRYFLVPMMMIAYAISGGSKLHDGMFRKIAFLLVIFQGALTIYSTPRLLIERYYLTPSQQSQQISGMMRTSAPLDRNNSIILMSRVHTSNLLLKRIAIRFSTHDRKNTGQAELRLSGLNGRTLAIPFNLADLANNKYKYFELDSKPYFSGRIIYRTGGGISIWENHEGKASAETCLIFEYTNGKKLYTPACPDS